ncbi:MAG TPA: T9SS type B sorting domain-containing protein, partial [Chryseolinea sp.]|nr:T9SS type B sorting domain-containing protein [Chryseolinea sp.]
LFLIGYATLDEYRDALQNIQYNYRLTDDEKGNPAEVSGGARSIYINVYDGQSFSLTYERKIDMEVKVALDIANTFTPNGDYQNDTWRVNVLNKADVGKAIIKVYDKRGVLLFEAKGFEKEWDGYFNGQVLPTDTYYYTIDLNLRYMKKTYKGAVTILH